MELLNDERRQASREKRRAATREFRRILEESRAKTHQGAGGVEFSPFHGGNLLVKRPKKNSKD
jgi:hypothetical protein